MAIRRSRVIVLVALGLLVASLWRTLSVEHQKRRIASEYDAAKQSLAQLEAERSQLTTELTQAHGTIDQQTGQLSHLQQELKGVQDRLDETVASLASLQRDHEQLRQQSTSLLSQLDSVTTEKKQLEAKLSSIKELKLAIHDIKRKMHDERWAAWRAHIQAVKDADQQRLASGNHGYVLRDGSSTIGASTKLHVRVLEPETK